MSLSSTEKALFGYLNVKFAKDINIVRIFTSSTFTDTSVERNTLMSRVYPRIKSFCRVKGYDFQVVDLRWGIREGSVDDHSISELCIKELQACQQLSTGPNFITFLGQKYGYRPLPHKIRAEEFDKIFAAIRDPEDIALVQNWYKKDDNSVPAHYVLQPISSRLVHFCDHAHAQLRQAAADQWLGIFERLRDILRIAASQVLEADEARKYDMSVTENEIRRGVLESSCPEKQCFWFKRVIKDLRENVEKPKAPFYIDVKSPDTIDETAQNLLENLKTEQIAAKIPTGNVIQYDVHWGEEGIDPQTNVEHEEYIDKLCDQFYDVLTRTISAGIESKKTAPIKDALTKELFHHGSFCQIKCKSFHGRDEFLRSVKERLLIGGEHLVAIYGESGCGKTSIMAKVASEARDWITDKFQETKNLVLTEVSCVVVYRFLGTSPDSSSPRLLLRSICAQLCRVSAQSPTKIPEDMKTLTEYFPQCLAKAAACHVIILILDSLDQVTGEGWSQELNWWPKHLPENVYAVLSTLPGQKYHCLSYLKSYLPSRCFLEVPKMNLGEARVLLNTWLSSANRMLQPHQRDIVLDAFQKCQLPLYLKLAFDEASRWNSYTAENETKLEENVDTMIAALFDHIEKKHGEILVSQAFGYITASKSGITELELDDLLSLNDKVLNDIYQFWTPPIRRMLPLLWFRLHADVEDYLIERGADGIPVVYWYHRQFVEAAKKRYLREEHVLGLHQDMAEYFIGRWACGRKKPYTDHDGIEIPMDRLVASQPLLFDANPHQPVFNKRKLNELPFHLVHARQLSDLKKETLCNFDFLSAKLRATSLEDLLTDLSTAIEVFDNDEELQVIDRLLHLSSMALRNDCNQLASQVIGRMAHFTDDKEKPFIVNLVKQAHLSCITGLPSFVTSTRCLISPGGALISSMVVDDQNASCSFSCDEVHVFVASSTKIGINLQVLVNSTGKLVRRFSLNLPEGERAYRWTLKASPLHANMVLVGGAQNVFLLNTNTGHVLKTFQVLSKAMKNFVYPMAFLDGDKKVASMGDEGVKIWTIDNRVLSHFIPIEDITMDTVKALDAYADWVVYSVQEDGFRIVNVVDGTQDSVFKLKDIVKEIRITPQQEIIILTTQRKSLFIFDLNSRVLLRTVPGFECSVGLNRLHLTADSRTAISFVDDHILISSLESGQVRRISKSQIFEENIDCTQLYSGDGKQLFAVGYDKVLRVYHLDKIFNNDQSAGRSLVSGTVSSVYPSYGDRYLATKTITNGQKELTIWDVRGRSGPQIVRCLKHEEGINELRMCSPTRAVGKFYSEGGHTCAFGVLDLKEGKIERFLPGDANLLWAVGLTDETHFMAFSREKKRLQLWDINKGTITFKHRFEKSQQISDVLANREKTHVVCGLVYNEKESSKSLPLIAFNCKSKRQHILKLKKQQLTLNAGSISHDGKFLVALTSHRIPTLWDVPTGKLICILPTDAIHATGVSSRTNIVITCKGETDAVMQMWDIETGCILSQYDTAPTHKVLVSADETLAYTFEGNNFYAWDLLCKQRVATFTMDWAPIPRHVSMVGDIIVVSIPEAPVIMTLRLQGPGFAAEKEREDAYGNVPVDGKLVLS